MIKEKVYSLLSDFYQTSQTAIPNLCHNRCLRRDMWNNSHLHFTRNSYIIMC